MPRDRVRILVLACFALLGVEMGVWGSRIPEVRLRTGLSYGTLGLALFAIPLATVVSLPIVSLAIERYGSRRVARGAVVLGPPTLIPLGYAARLLVLIPGLFLFGFALCTLNIAINAHAVQLERKHRRPLMAGFHAAFSVGAIVGAGLGALLAFANLSADASFTAAGVTFALAGCLVAGVWPASSDEVRLSSAAAAPLPSRGIGWRGTHGTVLALGFLAMCGAAAEGAMTDWSAVYLHDGMAASTGVASSGVSVFSAAVAIGRLAGDRLAARFGSADLLRISGVVGGSGLAAGIMSRQTLGAFVGFALMGLGLACVVPQIISAAGQAAHGSPSRNIAAVTGLSTAGNLGGPVLIGGVGDLAGLSVAMAVPAILMLVVAGGARVLRKPIEVCPSPVKRC